MILQFNNCKRTLGMKTLQASKALRSAVLLGSGAFLLGCVSSQDSHSAKTSDPSVDKTVKPGAAITISHTGPKDLRPGQYGVVTVKVTDSYEAGTLVLTAQPEEGLRLVTETAETTFPFSGDVAHEWELDVTSETSGVYYLNIFATAKLPEGPEMMRSYAARILIGDVTEADIRKSMKKNGALSGDGKTISMEAEETIQ